MNPTGAVVAFSGGKDSTAASLLLRKKNPDVRALFMKVGAPDEKEKEKKVRYLANLLEMPLTVVDARERFKNEIIDYFTDSYGKGLTPNPCAVCNQKIKFGLLREAALGEMGADIFATGHYAAKTEIQGRLFLKEPREKKKSQVYFLGLVGPEKLNRTLFPLSRVTLNQVREMTRDYPLAQERESQDVCFLSGIPLIEFLKGTIPEFFRQGDIVDLRGNRIGTHLGIPHFTLGQRRGTGFSSPGRLYVVKKDVARNRIVLGEDRDLFSRDLRVGEPVFWKKIKTGERYRAKVRYLGNAREITVTGVSDTVITGRFTRPIRAITPGQIAVFYERDRVVAAGHILG